MALQLQYRRIALWKTLGSYLAARDSFKVIACKAGAQVASSSSATPITVRAGHGFAANDKFVVWSGSNLDTTTATARFRTVTSVTTTAPFTIEYSGDPISVVAGDVLINLGADTGSSYPNFDGSQTIYSESSGTTAISGKYVTTNAQGEAEYWINSAVVWEVVYSGSTVYEVSINATGGCAEFMSVVLRTRSTTTGREVLIQTGDDPPTDYFNPAGTAAKNMIVLNKNSTDTTATDVAWFRDKQLRWATGEDYYQGDRSYFVPVFSDLGTTGVTSGDISGVSWFGAEGDNTHGSTGGSASPKWFWNGTPYGYYASTWTHHFFGGSPSGRSAIFQNYANSGSNGGIDVYTAGSNNAIEIRNQDGSSYRSSLRICRSTTPSGGTVNADWLVGMGIVTGTNTFSIYDQIAADTRYLINSSGSHIWSNANGTYTPTFPFDYLHEAATTNAAVNPFAIRYRLSTGTAAAGLGVYAQLRGPDAAGTDTRFGALGAVITDATAGALKARTEVWSSYATGPVLNVTHDRKVLINTTTETNATAITVAVDADNHAAITLAESTANPAQPTAGAEARLYMKADKLVVQYNDGGTTRYKYLDLTGTGVTWVHDTVAP